METIPFFIKTGKILDFKLTSPNEFVIIIKGHGLSRFSISPATSFLYLLSQILQFSSHSQQCLFCVQFRLFNHLFQKSI